MPSILYCFIDFFVHHLLRLVNNVSTYVHEYYIMRLKKIFVLKFGGFSLHYYFLLKIQESNQSINYNKPLYIAILRWITHHITIYPLYLSISLSHTHNTHFSIYLSLKNTNLVFCFFGKFFLFLHISPYRYTIFRNKVCNF